MLGCRSGVPYPLPQPVTSWHKSQKCKRSPEPAQRALPALQARRGMAGCRRCHPAPEHLPAMRVRHRRGTGECWNDVKILPQKGRLEGATHNDKAAGWWREVNKTVRRTWVALAEFHMLFHLMAFLLLLVFFWSEIASVPSNFKQKN